MAKKESRGRSGGYEALRTAIKAGVPANLYIFYGEERYLLQNMVQQLKELLIPGGFETHAWDDELIHFAKEHHVEVRHA